jgi:P27 family predicted phage terminase small subunit
MIRGRKPTPTHLKLVKGDPRQRGMRKLQEKAGHEARLPPALPSPPAELSDDAKLEWHRLCAHLHPAGLLSHVDRGALAAVCTAFARWMQIERLIAKVRAADQTFEGVLIRSAKNNLIVNPLLAAARVAMNDYCRLCTEFGMTPSSRSRIDDVGSEGDDPDDRFFDSA